MVMLPFSSPALREQRAGHMTGHRLYAILETQRPYFACKACVFSENRLSAVLKPGCHVSAVLISHAALCETRQPCQPEVLWRSVSALGRNVEASRWIEAEGKSCPKSHADLRGAEIHRRIEGAAGPVKLIRAWLEDIQ